MANAVALLLANYFIVRVLSPVLNLSNSVNICPCAFLRWRLFTFRCEGHDVTVITWLIYILFNPGKTKFLLIGTKLQLEKILNNFPCLILGQDTNLSTSAKNLGVLFDSSLNFRKHISQTCRVCFYHIRDLLRIWKSLSLDLAKQIAVALASSKLDYCNSFFHNMPEKDIAKILRVQNCLARVVTKAPRFSHSVSILKRLHWLPVKFLRSTNLNRFVVPRIKTKTWSRAFSISGPALWNVLPVPIRNAKTI